MDVADRLRLDVPVGQAGMGGGLACAPLAGAVAKAGGLGTLGLALPNQLRTSIDQVRAEAPGHAVAVNLLMPFVHRSHVRACVDARAGVVVVAFGKTLPAALNACSRWLGMLGYLDAGMLLRAQSPALPVFTPLAPLNGMPNSSVDSGALYAGDTALRIGEIVSAHQAVKDLAP